MPKKEITTKRNLSLKEKWEIIKQWIKSLNSKWILNHKTSVTFCGQIQPCFVLKKRKN